MNHFQLKIKTIMQQNYLNGQIIARHPEPNRKNIPIFPVFMPFAGCKNRCIFCSQERQTGTAATGTMTQLEKLLRNMDEAMEQRRKAGAAPVELAFFGGTFTAIPVEWQDACLQRARYWKEQGLVTSVRCSTRPDAISPTLLDALRAQGLETVELGIQSFADSALLASRRGYSADTARMACTTVREAGLALGVQLMPGLPGQNPQQASDDILLAVAAQPDFVRLYPCLVFAGTPLEQLWRQGSFVPLQTEAAIHFLAGACLHFWQHGIGVIRMGIAPEPSALRAIAAGPFHPAMGARARARALFLFLRDHIEKYQAITGDHQARWELVGPVRHQGEFWGHKKEMQPEYARLGIATAKWEARADFVLRRK